MKRLQHIIIGCLVATAFCPPAGAVELPAPIAVLDFTVPASADNRWAWAESGLADLLQIELERLGLVTLDRDFIHAVLSEQRLAAQGATENLTLASLLHARHLITGRVIPLEEKRFRVEASAFSVEAIETVVTGQGEGAFPKELTSVLQSVARRLAQRLKGEGAPASESGPSGYAPKPESLIMFYRGLTACAHGQPELGAACFMNAERLDTDFSAPLLWEIKAYEMAGFASHAAIRREEIAPILKRLGIELAGTAVRKGEGLKPVLAVLKPVVTGRNPSGNAGEPSALGTVLKQALLASRRVRLFAFENIGDAVAEQDLKLSSFFASQHAPRYGRWLMSDGLVVCRVTYSSPDQAALELAVVDPLTGATLNRVQGHGPEKGLPDEIRAAASELVSNWRNNPAPQPQVLSAAGLLAGETEEGGVELRPAFRNLAAALAQVRLAPTKSDPHRTLADALAATGRLRLAALEIERCLEHLDIRAPKADRIYFGAHRWLFGEPSPASCAAGLVDKRVIDRFIEQLLTTYPQTLAAGCMHYNLAVREWRAERWQDAIASAVQARQTLQSLIAHYDRKAQIEAMRGNLDCEIVAATYVVEASSLRKLGEVEEAKSVARRGLDYMREFSVRDFCLPLGPYLDDFFGGGLRVYGYGGEEPGLRTRLEKELVLLEGEPARPPGLDLPRDAADIVSATNAPSRTGEDWLRCSEQIAGLLNQAPPENVKMLKAILASAKRSLATARSKGAPATALRGLVQKCVNTFLAKQAMASLEDGTSVPVEKLTETAVEVMSVYESAGLKEEAWAVLQPLFNDRYPVELSLNLLQQLNWNAERYSQELKRAAARLPVGQTNVSMTVWLKLGQIYHQNQRPLEALDCYQKAVAQGALTGQCSGLLSALVEVALERNLAQPREELEKIRREFNFPPLEASWVEWFATGRKYRISREYDLDKAVACYRNTLEFLEHPEQGGIYRLEKEPGCERMTLRWGQNLGEMDLLWSENYDSRWHSAAFHLAQCLIGVGQKEEAAQWLRRIARKAGGDVIALLDETTWNSTRYQMVQIGVRAADQLKALHTEPARPKFGETDGPYKRAVCGRKASRRELPPLPAPNPDILLALKNTLAEAACNPRSRETNLRLQGFVRNYGHDGVPALLSLLPRAGELWDEATLRWLLSQIATPTEAAYVVEACKNHWNLIDVATKLDLHGTAAALAEEWRAQSESGSVHFLFIFAVIDARLRPLYPLVLDHIAERKANHHSVIFRMEEVVNAEKSSGLELAFREALASCLKLKLAEKEYYELPRISQVALRQGVLEGIEGLMESLPPEQWLPNLRPSVDLPANDAEALQVLRAHRSNWEWDAKRKKFSQSPARSNSPQDAAAR